MSDSRTTRKRGSHVTLIPIQREEDPTVDDLITSPQSLIITDSDPESNASSTNIVEDSESPANTSTDTAKKTLPAHNVPEKIIIVVDRAQDDMFTKFHLSSGESFTPLQMLKRALLIFLHSKYMINSKHQFALVALEENSATWVQDFTSNIEYVLQGVNQLDTCATEDIFDLNSLFNVIMENVQLPTLRDDLLEPPSSVVRLVLLYGRSYTVPEIVVEDQLEDLLSSPNFTFDVLMTHEPPDADNNCDKIFEIFQSLDRKGSGYFFPVARNSQDLYNAMAKLLSHPLQRPTQNRAKYTISAQGQN